MAFYGSPASITQRGTIEPFDLQVARGQIPYHNVVSLFGYQSAIGNTTTPVWEVTSVYPAYLSSAATFYLYSASASDSGAVVFVSGLDANFNPVSEVVVLNGQTAVTTVNKYFRVNGLNMVSVASGQTSNVGIITVKQTTNTLAQINAGIGKSQSTIYTVPANNTFYLDIAEVNSSNSYKSSTILTYKVQAINNVTGVALTVLPQPFVSIYTINRSTVPFTYTEKTDIQWQLATSTSTVAAGVVIAGKLIANA